MPKLSEQEILDEMVTSYPVLSDIQADVRKAYEVMRDSYRYGGKLLICGNGGSAGASDHIACELLKTMELKRPLNTAQRKMIMERYPEEGAWLADNLTQGLPTISLLGHAAFLSAMDNDVNSDLAYAQAVFSLGKPGDVLLAISTSGKAKNVKNAVRVANAIGMHTVALTGRLLPDLKDLCEVAICTPGESSVRVLERHLPIYHVLCRLLENYFFD
jgi:D-sedoheptulose 7-phosphate isomerase